MNYRHAFHAGNFADLLKHACLTALLSRMTALPGALQVLDTHAGAGVYQIGSEMARRSGEAQAGVVRLMADPAAPAVFDALKAAVRRLNPEGGVALYPGSPLLAAAALRPGDRYLGCELRADDQAILEQALAAHGRGQGQLQSVVGDGYRAAARLPSGGRILALIDPPYERGDDYSQAARAAGELLRRDGGAVVAIWLPLKDLDTFDRFVIRLEDDGPPPTLIVEARLRPLDDPLKMNGCAMAIVGAPAGLADELEAAARWIVAGTGGASRLWSVGG